MTPRARLVRRLVAALASVAVFNPAFAPAQPQPASAEAGPRSWKCSSADLALGDDRVELAPVSPREKTPSGGPIVPAPDARVRWVPVVVVHGWTSRSTHPSADGTDETAGAFSHLIDLTANRVGAARVTRSLIGQLQGVPGAAVFTFDYHPYSGRWVSDSHLGPALGKVIDCLQRAAQEKVILVGHSMGGLVSRFAASEGGGVGRSAKISRIITLGTPNEGSIAATIMAGIIDGVSVTAGGASLFRMLLSACGTATTERMDTGTVCDVLPAVAAFEGEAGRALRYQSPELRGLPRTPRGITVNALSGDTLWEVPKLGWFSLPWETTELSLGDAIVSTGSATFGASTTEDVSCRYQLSAVRGATDQLGLRLKVLAANDAAASPLNTASGPCFHTSLMRSIELTNDVMGYVADDISARNRLGKAILGEWYVHGSQLTIEEDGSAESTGNGGPCGPPDPSGLPDGSVWCTTVLKLRAVPSGQRSAVLTVVDTFMTDSNGERRPYPSDRPRAGDYYVLRVQPDGLALTELHASDGSWLADKDSANNLGNPWLCRPGTGEDVIQGRCGA